MENVALGSQRVRPVQLDLLAGDPTTLIQRICRQVGVDPNQVLFVWGSTPCETNSPLDATNSTVRAGASEPHNFRDHSHPERPPRSEDLSDPKTATAIQHDEFLPRLQLMLAADRLRDLHYNFMFENPAGSLQRRPFMQISAWPRMIH